MGWPQERVYTLHPFNSPVVVLYWRVMLPLLRFLNEEARHTVAAQVWSHSSDNPDSAELTAMNWAFTQQQASQDEPQSVSPPASPQRSQPAQHEKMSHALAPPERPPVLPPEEFPLTLVILRYQNTRRMVTVRTVPAARDHAVRLFDVDPPVTLLHDGVEVTDFVRLDMLPPVATLDVQ